MTINDMVNNIQNSGSYRRLTSEEVDEYYLKQNPEARGRLNVDPTSLKIVPVKQEYVNKLLEQNKKEWIDGYGLVRGDKTKVNEMIKKFSSTEPIKDKANVAHTLTKIVSNQDEKFFSIIKQHNPNWVWGEPFDPKILDETHIDITI
ncbi:DUF3879 family protein [Criibacterium bergeronii]|uniref:Uncharacterized protein n=1 Tax=Criibacterium bergeronii TaxID=1871336 RepID=A0A371ING0_9FIRM|nr:DUF3879 family protein [Criibacterium bergeronii]MBS6063269.1 DUF3879 family protein [Peptostreptococcaceae bacterium]RDY22019.1 hypothetical protein BBG48_001360 [Criibacterium bergeronii]TRW22473.1 hypothetical protein FL857_11185 [Criibacterium bergeronii]